MNSQSCPESLRSARSYHWEWCTINNELRTTSGRRVLGGRPRHRWVLATAAIGSRQRPRLCGHKRSQKVLWVPRLGAMWCVHFPISVWSGTACLLKRLLVLPEALHCSYPVSEKSARRRTSFFGTHNTFWRSSLPRRALQPRARARARRGRSSRQLTGPG